MREVIQVKGPGGRVRVNVPFPREGNVLTAKAKCGCYRAVVVEGRPEIQFQKVIAYDPVKSFRNVHHFKARLLYEDGGIQNVYAEYEATAS